MALPRPRRRTEPDPATPPDAGGATVPALTVRGARTPAALAVVLHGGREHSFAPTTAWQGPALRMVPFALHLTSAGRPHRLGVWTVRFRYQGWNGDPPHGHASPLDDAAWALDRAATRHPGVPVVLVGHSMGARTALRSAGHPHVVGVAALAPWVPRHEPVDQLTGRHLLIVHGTADRTTPHSGGRRYADRARDVAETVTFRSVEGEGHAMLRHPSVWHDTTTDFTLSCLTRQDASSQDAP